jgi:hypothetical protein
LKTNLEYVIDLKDIYENSENFNIDMILFYLKSAICEIEKNGFVVVHDVSGEREIKSCYEAVEIFCTVAKVLSAQNRRL